MLVPIETGLVRSNGASAAVPVSVYVALAARAPPDRVLVPIFGRMDKAAALAAPVYGRRLRGHGAANVADVGKARTRFYSLGGFGEAGSR